MGEERNFLKKVSLFPHTPISLQKLLTGGNILFGKNTFYRRVLKIHKMSSFFKLTPQMVFFQQSTVHYKSFCISHLCSPAADSVADPPNTHIRPCFATSAISSAKSRKCCPVVERICSRISWRASSVSPVI